MADLLVVAMVFIAVIVSFIVVPEVAERVGLNPRSARVRAGVWIVFLLILFVPALILASGFLRSVLPIDWLLFVAAIAVAILYDYYRLNPDRVPRRRESP